MQRLAMDKVTLGFAGIGLFCLIASFVVRFRTVTPTDETLQDMEGSEI